MQFFGDLSTSYPIMSAFALFALIAFTRLCVNQIGVVSHAASTLNCNISHSPVLNGSILGCQTRLQSQPDNLFAPSHVYTFLPKFRQPIHPCSRNPQPRDPQSNLLALRSFTQRRMQRLGQVDEGAHARSTHVHTCIGQKKSEAEPARPRLQIYGRLCQRSVKRQTPSCPPAAYSQGTGPVRRTS